MCLEGLKLGGILKRRMVFVAAKTWFVGFEALPASAAELRLEKIRLVEEFLTWSRLGPSVLQEHF